MVELLVLYLLCIGLAVFIPVCVSIFLIKAPNTIKFEFQTSKTQCNDTILIIYITHIRFYVCVTLPLELLDDIL